MKKITPQTIKVTYALILLLISQNLFSQNVDVILSVNWPQWSTENRVEFYDSNDMLLQTIDNGFNGSGAAANPYNETTTAVSYLVNSSTTAGYYVIVYDTYGDGWNGNGSLTITADGANAFTFDGNFDTSATNSQISQTIYFAINAQDDASFSYSQTSYCPTTDSNPTPTITGEAGGTFSSTSGLSINSSTGEINLSTSTEGTYQVTYTTTAPNQNSSQESVIIGGGSTFTYTTSSATQSDADLSPTTTGPSGTFSSTAGLSINSATGIIDVSASTPGTYCVTYSTTETCPAGEIVLTDDVIITATNFPGTGTTIYNNTANDFPNNASTQYIKYIPGNMPVIISAPHGGKETGSELPTRNCGTSEEDNNTDILIKEIQKLCYEQYGLYPYIIVSDLRRSKLDPNRVKSVATCGGNSITEEYFDAFHYFIDEASAEVTTNYGKGLYIDLHGQSHSIPRVEAGYNLQSSVYNASDINSAANLAKVTIKNLIENNIQSLGFDDMLRGSDSFGGLMQVTGGSEYAAAGHAGCGRTVGYRTVPSHIDNGSSNCDDTNPSGSSYFAGDYYNNIRHGSGDSTVSNSASGGGSLNGGGGTIDGIMTEVNRRVRDLGNSYAGAPYNRTDGQTATLEFFARDYATVIKDFIDLHYNDFSNFSFGSSTYDTTDSNPTPTITGISGGVFTSSNPTGLVINSSTGVIDLSASSAGVYTITYLAPNIEPYYKKLTTVTITSSSALDDASFSYDASSYCKNDINPTPTITGETGGTFTSASGLNFVSSSTGEINLSTSTAGTYTITYTTLNPGQNTDTFEVTINANDIDTFNYATDTACISDSDLTATTSGESGTFSSTSGLTINSTSGLIDVSASTPGTYTVTYTTTGTCPITLTDAVTINAADVATFSYATDTACISDSDLTATTTGESGTFSSTSGLTINSTSGLIDVSASTPGTYTVSFLTTGTCPITLTDAVTINAADVATFSYPTDTACISDSDLTATTTGESGTFSSTTGLVINSTSGLIDVSASTPGTYTVSFLTTGTCPITLTDAVTINAADVATFSYPTDTACISDSDLTATNTGESGTFSSTTGLVINSTSGLIDVSASTPGTYTVSFLTTGTCPITLTDAVTINAADVATFSYPTDTACISDSDLTATTTGESGTFSSTTGLVINSTSGLIDVSASTPGTYTVSFLTTGTCPITLTDAVTINAADVATFSYSAASYDVNDSDPIATITGTSGGTFSSTAGIILNSSTGEIDLSASNPDTYTITYTVNGVCGTVMNTFDVEITGTVLDIIDEEFITFSLYPNPTKGLITIKSNTTITKVIIHDMLGRKINTVKLDVNNQIDMTELERATYLLTLYNENKRLGTKPIIKK